LKLSDEEIWVVDGQQRLTAVFEFFSNDLALSQKSSEKFGGEYYKDLPTKYADAFDDFEIEFDLIEDADEKELKEFFQRLQQGLPLTSSEKLNSVHSKLRDFCRKMAQRPFLALRVLASDKRYGHFDIVAKVASIEIEGLDVGLRYDDLREVFESQANFSSASRVAKRIEEALRHLDRVFRNGRDPSLRNRSIVQSFVTLVCRIIEVGKAAGTEKRLHRFFKNFIFELSVRLNWVLMQRTMTTSNSNER
jgi:hypothetical protein